MHKAICSKVNLQCDASLLLLQALRNFQALRVVLAIAAGAFAASSMAVAAIRGLTGGLTPLWFGAAAVACTAIALAANHFVKLLTYKVYEHHKH